MSIKIGDIHRKLAPFLVTGLSGTGLYTPERELLAEAPPAGIILFARNVLTAGQLLELSDEIRSIVEDASGMTPLIMADHEGGRISVLADAAGVPPSPMAAWSGRSEELLTSVLKNTMTMLRSCGVDLVLAPVADIASEPLNPVIGTRSFGEDPAEVAEAVRIAVRTMAENGILSCVKHFPGHGRTSSDSHLTLPVLGRSVGQIRGEELLPFTAGIEAGADLVMTAHIALAEGGPPASLDRDLVTGLLRDELGFEGVVITDALEMAGALPDGIAMRSVDPSAGEKAPDAVPALIAARALEAGNDLLLMSRPIREVYRELQEHEEILGQLLGADGPAAAMKKAAGRIAALREKAASGLPEEDENLVVLDTAAGKISAEWMLMKRLFEGVDISGNHILPVFLGEKADFDNFVVRRFISWILHGYTGQAGAKFNIDPVQVTDISASGGGELLLYEPALGPGKGRCLVILCRRPQPEEVLRELTAGYDLVAAAARPWDAGLVPEGTPVITTYGVYDAAAHWLGSVLKTGDWP
jgi:beta-glucosidase-like glycosyl hydrolase